MLANQIGPGPYFRFAFITPLYWTPWLVIIHSSTRCFSMLSVGVQVNTKMFQRNQIQIGETVKELTFQDLVDFVDGNKGAIDPKTPVKAWSYPDLNKIAFEATSVGFLVTLS